MEIIIGIVSLIVAVVGVYFAYLQLKHTPKTLEKDTAPKAEDNTVNAQNAIVTEPLQDNVSVEELMLLLDWFTSESIALRQISTTFGEKRRILTLLIKLREKASAYWGLVSNAIENSVAEQMSFFIQETLRVFLAEVNAVLPLPDEERITLETDTWKKLTYNLGVDWEALKNMLLQDANIKTKFLRLKTDETHLWSLVGFDNAQDYQEYVAPTITTISKDTSVIQKELLSRLVEGDVVTADELEKDGFPKGVVIETFNSLMRSELLQYDLYD